MSNITIRMTEMINTFRYENTWSGLFCFMFYVALKHFVTALRCSLFLLIGETLLFLSCFCHFLILTSLLESFCVALQTGGGFPVPFKCKWLCVKNESRAEYEREKKCTSVFLFLSVFLSFLFNRPLTSFFLSIPQTFSRSDTQS